jgi:hypothetical protein
VVTNQSVRFEGAARFEQLATGGVALYLGAQFLLSRFTNATTGRNTVTPRNGAAPEAGADSKAGLFSRAALTLATANPRAGSWIGLRCERNVFGLQRGDTTNFNAQAIVAATTQNTPLLEFELNGVLQITKAATASGSVQKLSGRIAKAQFSIRGVAFDSGGEIETSLVDLSVSVTLSGSKALDLVFGFDNDRIEFSASWDKQPLAVKLGLKLVKPNDNQAETEITLADATLNETADVLAASNASHVRALDALEVIAGALGDINFADAKARLLFPPPPPPQDQLIVRGTRDWVLFHRRRNKRCSPEQAPAPLPAPARLYQVYHFPVNNRDEAESLRRILLSGQVPNDPGPQTAGVIEFAGGVAALVTPPDAVAEATGARATGA